MPVHVADEGDASRFRQLNTEYAKAPEVTRNRLYLETMQLVYTNTSKVLIDAMGQGNLLYLPLDKLMQAAGSVPAATTSSHNETTPSTVSRSAPAMTNETPPQVADRPEVRTRDALRSRDREVR